jgi:hypothetical protein
LISVPQEDDDGHLCVLSIMQDLMDKARHVFLEHFARLGLYNRVLMLAGPMALQEEGAKAKDDKVGNVIHTLGGQLCLLGCCANFQVPNQVAGRIAKLVKR